MSKSHLKSTIRKAQAGIAFIILAAVLSQFLYVAQYIYTRRKIHQQTVEKTSNDMERMQRITNRKTSVESAVHATMGDVRVNLNDDIYLSLFFIKTRLIGGFFVNLQHHFPI